MNKWLKIGALLLLLAWAPFIYAELTSSPAEKKARDLPSVAGAEDELEAEPAAPEPDPEGDKVAAAPAEAEEAEEPEHAEREDEAEGELDEPEEPAADPGQPALQQRAEAPAEPEPAEAAEEVAGDEEAQEEEAPPPVASGPTAQLKHAFETEPRDPLWASDTERRINATFGSDDIPEGMLERVSCRRAVCRLDVRWTRDHATQYVGAYEALRDQFGNELAVEPEGAVDDEGRQLVHLYVLRKGYTAADLSR